MIKKAFVSAVVALAGLFCQGAVINNTSTDGNPLTIPTGSNESTSGVRPRAPRTQAAFSVCYAPGIHALVVTSSSDVGVVVAVIENLSTGAFYTYSFDSSEPALLPVNGEPGLWRITLFVSRSNTFTDYFQIV